MRRGGVSSLLLVLLLCAASCESGGKDPIRIGLLADCEGFSAAYYDVALAGAELSLIQRGGQLQGSGPVDGIDGVTVGGTPVDLVFGCAGEGIGAFEETRRLVELEGVDVLIGSNSSTYTEALIQYARRHPETTFISDTMEHLNASEQTPNLFRFSADAVQTSAGLGSFAREVLGWRRAATLAAQTCGDGVLRRVSLRNSARSEGRWPTGSGSTLRPTTSPRRSTLCHLEGRTDSSSPQTSRPARRPSSSGSRSASPASPAGSCTPRRDPSPRCWIRHRAGARGPAGRRRHGIVGAVGSVVGTLEPLCGPVQGDLPEARLDGDIRLPPLRHRLLQRDGGGHARARGGPRRPVGRRAAVPARARRGPTQRTERNDRSRPAAPGHRPDLPVARREGTGRHPRL